MMGLERISPAPNTMHATPPSMYRVSLSVPESEWLLFSATIVSFQNDVSDFLRLFLQNSLDHGNHHFHRFVHRRCDGFAQSHVSLLAAESGGLTANQQDFLQPAIHGRRHPQHVKRIHPMRLHDALLG